MWQGFVSEVTPVQMFPSFAGLGLLHDLSLVDSPVPHVTLQVDHIDHVDH